MRFTSSELQLLGSRGQDSEACFSEVDKAFKTLSAKAKKLALPSEEATKPMLLPPTTPAKTTASMATTTRVKSTDDFGFESGHLDLGSYAAPSAEEVLAAAAAAATAEDSVTAKSADDSSTSANSSTSSSTASGSSSSSGGAGSSNHNEEEDAVLEEVRRFHGLADRFMKAYRLLVVELVAKKQAEMKSGRKKKGEEGEGGKKEDEDDEDEEDEEIVVDKDHGEGLKNAKPLPEYLSVLLAK